MKTQAFFHNIRFFDGALGTECIRRRLPVGTPPELWNLDHPEIIREIHRNYIEAGAQVITTNTFGGNRLRLRAKGLDERINEINWTAVRLARDEAFGKALVAGSVGPLGEMIEPYGSLSETEAMDTYQEHIALLVEAEVDFILIETMISLNEALIALKAGKEVGDHIVGVSFSFEGGDEPRTAFGESPEDVAQAIARSGADFIGANCGDGFETMLTVAKQLIEHTSLPVLIQSNAGLPVFREGQVEYPESPKAFADFAERLHELQVDFIGGCCGTTSEHMRVAYDRCQKA